MQEALEACAVGVFCTYTVRAQAVPLILPQTPQYKPTFRRQANSRGVVKPRPPAEASQGCTLHPQSPCQLPACRQAATGPASREGHRALEPPLASGTPGRGRVAQDSGC